MGPNEMETPRPWVKFGPKEHQEITVEVASMILTTWREQHPEQFGMYLAEAMTGARPSAARKKKQP